MVCFADINVSQSTVATYAMCSWMFNIHLTASLLRNLPVKFFFVNRLRFDRIMVTSLWSRFLAHPVCNIYNYYKQSEDRQKNKITRRTKKNKGTKGTRTETQLNVVSCVMRTRTRAIGNGNVPKIVTDNPINYFLTETSILL